MSEERFVVERPQFDSETGTARFGYALGEHRFVELVDFGGRAPVVLGYAAAFEKLLHLTAAVLGVSYFKLRAPFSIALPDLPLTEAERAFVLDIYENGLGEFFARNDLRRFGRLTIEAPQDPRPDHAMPDLPARALLPIGGGKDSLVSAQLLAAAGSDFSPFAVNPKGPILSSVERLGRPPVYVTRTLDPEMLRLSAEPGYYNGHVPSTAINSMIAALAAVLFGYDQIVLSNERSASEGNITFDGRDANHQYSKSLGFERLIAKTLTEATGGKLGYFSLLRPFSEAKIAGLFARDSRFDDVFSSCNRNFRLKGHSGPLWCGECPKCHFVFLVFAPVMDRDRLTRIFGGNLLDRPENETSFRTLTGLAGQKPWECVGEILEAAACLFALTRAPAWQNDRVVAALAGDLLRQYGAPQLDAALIALMADSPDHLIPPGLAGKVAGLAA